MRVIDCECGQTLEAANDDDLVNVTREHVNESHPDMELDDDGVRALVADKAYEAMDARSRSSGLPSRPQSGTPPSTTWITSLAPVALQQARGHRRCAAPTRR